MQLSIKVTAINYLNKSNEIAIADKDNVISIYSIETREKTFTYKMILNETYWNAYTFYDSLFELFDSQMKEKGIKFTGKKYVEHSEVICDDTKLREIFFNILI